MDTLHDVRKAYWKKGGKPPEFFKKKGSLQEK